MPYNLIRGEKERERGITVANEMKLPTFIAIAVRVCVYSDRKITNSPSVLMFDQSRRGKLCAGSTTQETKTTYNDSDNTVDVESERERRNMLI